MSKTAWRTVLLGLALLVLLPAAVMARVQKTPLQTTSTTKAGKAEKTPSKLPLSALTLVSTSAAARKVAAEATAKALAPKNASPTLSPVGSEQETSGSVREFQTDNTAGLSDSSNGTFQMKNHKRSMLKNIHGSVYGATASGIGRANTVDGAVGADSSNGKFSVYMQGEHSHISTPPPH